MRRDGNAYPAPVAYSEAIRKLRNMEDLARRGSGPSAPPRAVRCAPAGKNRGGACRMRLPGERFAAADGPRVMLAASDAPRYVAIREAFAAARSGDGPSLLVVFYSDECPACTFIKANLPERMAAAQRLSDRVAFVESRHIPRLTTLLKVDEPEYYPSGLMVTPGGAKYIEENVRTKLGA